MAAAERVQAGTLPNPHFAFGRLVEGNLVEWERALGSVFINREGYGTRASAVLRVSAGRVMATEVNYAPDASVAQSADFSFEISPARP